MKNILIVLTLILFTISSADAQKATPNVVIENMEEVYKLVASKDGSTLAKVELSTQITFRANRVADKGIALAYYNDDLKIDKASGGATSYGPYFGSDIFFSDSKACIVAVDLKKGGAKGKASFKRTYTKPEFFCKALIYESYDIENANIVFEIPESLSERFKIVEKNIPAEKTTRSEERKGDKLIITYTLKNIAKPEFYSNAPSINITAPQFIILGHYSDVNELYRYLRSYTLNDDPGAATVVAKAKEITANCTTDAERIAAITDFVHNTVRYVAVEHGEFGQRPDLPSEVLRKTYGDCKCSAALIKAMLNAVGIDGRLVWVGTTNISEKWTDVPNVSSGDHMIAAAMTGDSILFIDGTAKYNPSGTLPLGVQGCQALVEDGPDKCIVATTPITPPSSNAIINKHTYQITPQGDMEISGTITTTGAYTWAMNDIIADTPPTKRDEKYKKFFSTVASGSHTSEATLTEYTDSLVFTGKASLSGAVKKAGEIIYVDLNPDSDLTDLKFTDKDRIVSGKINREGTLRAIMTLMIPESADIAETPRDITIDNQWIYGTISTTPSNDGRSLIRNYHLEIKDHNVSLADFEKFNTDINRLNRACTAKIVLKSK